jgi:predicted kinase
VHEYAALTAAALEVRSAGCPVVLVAPFTTQIRRPEEWVAWVGELGGEPVRLLWVRCDPATLRDRIVRRGRVKDRAKLDDYEAFVARVQPERPPHVPHLTVDTSTTAAPVPEQLRRLLLT